MTDTGDYDFSGKRVLVTGAGKGELNLLGENERATPIVFAKVGVV